MPIGKKLLFKKSISSANYVSLQNCFKYITKNEKKINKSYLLKKLSKKKLRKRIPIAIHFLK